MPANPPEVEAAGNPQILDLVDLVDLAVALSANGTFEARLKVRGPVASLTGQWAVTDGLLLTSAVVTPRSARQPARG